MARRDGGEQGPAKNFLQPIKPISITLTPKATTATYMYSTCMVHTQQTFRAGYIPGKSGRRPIVYSNGQSSGSLAVAVCMAALDWHARYAAAGMGSLSYNTT